MRGRRGFEYKEHTADVRVVAHGDSLEEVFENSALALFDTMTEVDKVETGVEDIYVVEGFDELSLLYSWIENFIVEFDVNMKLYSKFRVERIEEDEDGFKLRATARGEVFDRDKHPSKTEVKAITYHGMKIERNNGVRAEFILDI